MTREERVLNLISKKSIDYLPSNIFFAAYETKEAFRKLMNFNTI